MSRTFILIDNYGSINENLSSIFQQGWKYEQKILLTLCTFHFPEVIHLILVIMLKIVTVGQPQSTIL